MHKTSVYKMHTLSPVITAWTRACR